MNEMKELSFFDMPDDYKSEAVYYETMEQVDLKRQEFLKECSELNSNFLNLNTIQAESFYNYSEMLELFNTIEKMDKKSVSKQKKDKLLSILDEILLLDYC